MIEDFDVFEVGNGFEVMVWIKEGLFDFIIFDVGLFDMDGCELCCLMCK